MADLDLEALERRPTQTITVIGRSDGVKFVLISPEERDAILAALERIPQLGRERDDALAGFRVCGQGNLELQSDIGRLIGRAERVEAAARRPLVWDSSVEGEVQALRRRLAEIDVALAPAPEGSDGD